MRIALLVPGGVDRSGTERVIPLLLWLIESLTQQGIDVQVFAHNQEPLPGTWPLLGARVHNAGGSRRRMLRQVVQQNREERFDVLHAIWLSPAGVVAACAGAMLGAPVLLQLTGGDLTALRDIDYGAQRRIMGRLWLRAAVAGADRIIVPSEFLRTQAQAKNIKAERLTLGIAHTKWPLREPVTRNPSQPARLLSVGTINRVKGHDTLFHAAANLHESGVRFTLDIVGLDTMNGSIHNLSRELGLDDVVKFHGELQHAMLRPLVERADILVVSSRHEADPVAMLEAATVGVPTVGTSVGHVVEWAPQAAVAVPVGDAAAMAKALSDLIADEDSRMRVAEKAFAFARTMDVHCSTARLGNIYRELTNKV